MIDFEEIGAWLPLLLSAIAIGIGILIVVSPYFCWQLLKDIRKRQIEASKMVDARLANIQSALESLNETLSRLSVK